jgi:hypothetical protein
MCREAFTGDTLNYSLITFRALLRIATQEEVEFLLVEVSRTWLVTL